MSKIRDFFNNEKKMSVLFIFLQIPIFIYGLLTAIFTDFLPGLVIALLSVGLMLSDIVRYEVEKEKETTNNKIK